MLTTAERTLAREHQTSISALTDIVQREVSRLVTSLEGGSPALVREALRDLVPSVVNRYGDAAAALAMDYFEMAREAAEVPGMFIPMPASAPPRARLDESIRWAVGALVGDDPSFDALGGRLGGSVSRAVIDVATETITGATVKDKRANGWSRIVEPNGCKFCRMLADRGAVYSGESVRFASHDNCRCSAAPRFRVGPNDVPAGPVQYAASKRREKRTEADKRRVREYLAAHYPAG